MVKTIEFSHIGHGFDLASMELYGELAIKKRTKFKVYPDFFPAYDDFEIQSENPSLYWDNKSKKFYIHIFLVGALFYAPTLEELMKEIKSIECLEFFQVGWAYTKFPEIDFLGRMNEGMDMVKMASSLSDARGILSENLLKVYKENTA